MHYHILLRHYRQNCYSYSSVVKNTYSPCHKHACVQISIGNTEWLLRYKGVSYTCFSGDKASFHRERWLGETPLWPISRPRIARVTSWHRYHYSDVIMNAMAYHTTSLTIVYSTVYSGADQRKHQSSMSLTFVRGIHR